MSCLHIHFSAFLIPMEKGGGGRKPIKFISFNAGCFCQLKALKFSLPTAASPADYLNKEN